MSGAERPGGAHAQLRGARALVMGLGSFGGGVGAVRYLCAQGARVRVTDLRQAAELAPALEALAGLPVEYTLGQHLAADFESCELVIANPAVAPSHALLAAARAHGARIRSEMELFLEACPARVVAITGTQGKSSTTTLCAQLLQRCGARVHLGGNIGRSLLQELGAMQAQDFAVLEISSYQLEALAAPRELAARASAVACVNVLADHLERHGTIEAYEAAKRRVLDLLDEHGLALLNAADERVGRWTPPRGRALWFWPARSGAPLDPARRASDLYVHAGRYWLGALELGRCADLRLPGSFQHDNALAALGLAHALGAEPAALRAAIPELRGLSYRVEDLGLRAGHRVIDNGVSTTPDSTVAALRDRVAPCVLLCGGKQKALPLDELVELARSKVRIAICFGSAGPALAAAFARGGVAAEVARDVPAAVALAFERARESEEILFSPACASFDAYLNFEQRAQHFRACLPPAASSLEAAR